MPSRGRHYKRMVEYMNSLLWFLFGLFLGLGLDFLLVLHMLKPLKKRISDLEAVSKQMSWFDTYDLFSKIMWIWFHGMGVIFSAITLYIIWSTIKIYKEQLESFQKFDQICPYPLHPPTLYLLSIGLIEPIKWSIVEHCGE